MLKNKTKQLLLLAICVVLMLIMAACRGTTKVTVADLPAYPDAVRLQADEDPIADTLAQTGRLQ